MLITTYTSYAEVRSTVGLSSVELPDELLALGIYANSLEMELDSVSLTDLAPGPGPLKSRFVAIAAITEAARTAAEQNLYNLTRLFCTYVVAVEVATSLSMRAPKIISDSKTTLTRFSPENTWRDVAQTLAAKMSGIKDRIEALGETTVTSSILMYKVVPDYDPVTGEST